MVALGLVVSSAPGFVDNSLTIKLHSEGDGLYNTDEDHLLT